MMTDPDEAYVCLLAGQKATSNRKDLSYFAIAKVKSVCITTSSFRNMLCRWLPRGIAAQAFKKARFTVHTEDMKEKSGLL